MKPQIQNIDIIGDSLTDRGDLADDKLLGILSMNWLSGLSGKSFTGRFTNGFVWSDFLGVRFARESGYMALETLKPERMTTETGNTILRTFAKGGLTACDWSTMVTLNPKLLASRNILSTLSDQRLAMFKDDAAAHITAEEKKSHLVIEWSGANDLVTVNSEALLASAQKAVDARIANLEELLKNDYQHICLLDLPDISKAPRFQRLDASEIERAKEVINFFNKKLNEEVNSKKEKYPNATIDVFNTNELFAKLHAKPKDFGFDPTKLLTPLSETEPFKKAEYKCDVDATGYVYWDDVHPTEAVQFELSKAIYDFLDQKYELEATRETLINIFQENYGRDLDDNPSACCGLFAGKHFEYKKPGLTLEDIFNHAIIDKGGRTSRVIQKLGWLDKHKLLLAKNSNLKDAYDSSGNQSRTHSVRTPLLQP